MILPPKKHNLDSKYFINIEKIISITFNKERISSYTWCDETIIKSWFGLSNIKIKAGWKYTTKADICSSEQLIKNQEYRVDEINKIVYDKASIDIYLEDKIISEWFDTDADALKWIDELIVKSGKLFQVLENE